MTTDETKQEVEEILPLDEYKDFTELDNRVTASEVIKTCMTVVMSVLLTFLVVFNYYTVRVNVVGISMEPTIHDKQKGFSIRISAEELNRGDIVVVTAASEDFVIKRVIGLPGDEVFYRDGNIEVNGKVVKEDYIMPVDMTDERKAVKWHVQLEDDEYFVMGDNRDNSHDSRDYGAVKGKQILSRYFFSFENFRLVKYE